MPAPTDHAQPVAPKTEQPATRKATRCPDHYRHHKGCHRCQAWSRAEAAERRARARAGTEERSVPVAVAQQHLARLLDSTTGGWTQQRIAERSGVSIKTVNAIVCGRSKTVFHCNWTALAALQPTGKPAPYTHRKGEVSSLESARIVRGLLAQAWTTHHMAGLIGHRSPSRIREIGRQEYACVTPQVRDAIRALADKLGPYNGVLMDELLPGQDPATAARALTRGFHPLAAWAGQDLADPDATPGLRPWMPPDPANPTEDLIIPVDQVKLARVRVIHEQILATETRSGHRADGYVRPIGGMTRLEQHMITDYATSLGMSAAEVAETIGYPTQTPADIEAGQRTVTRILAEVRAARTSIENHPAGHVPAWIAKPAGISMPNYLPAMLALQPAPIGLDMTAEQLAAFCGVTDDVMRQYLTRAARRVNVPWQPKVVKRRRNQGATRCAQPTRTQAA